MTLLFARCRVVVAPFDALRAMTDRDPETGPKDLPRGSTGILLGCQLGEIDDSLFVYTSSCGIPSRI
jgi:hypothetical protein